MGDGTNLSAITDLLKNVYGDAITEQFNNETITYNQFEKSSRKPSGKGYVFGVSPSNPQGIGSRGDSQKLPEALPGKYDQSTIVPKYHYATLRTTGPAIEASKGNLSAFVEALGGEINTVYNGLIVDMNRQCWGDGYGKLATVTTVGTVATGATYTMTFNDDVGTRYLQPGMVVDLITGATGTANTKACSGRIASIAPATGVVTFEAHGNAYAANHPNATMAAYTGAATTSVVGDFLCRSGSRQTTTALTTAGIVELTGLDGIYDDGTAVASFQGITVSGNEWWAANMMGNSSVDRELTTELMLQALDLTRIRSGMKPACIRMGLGQRRKYAELLLPDVRFAPGELKGGYETLTFAGGDGSVKIVVDPVAQPGAMYFETAGAIKKYEMTPIGWGNLDGSQMHRRAGYDAYDQFLRVYTNLGTEQRNCLTKLYDLVEPSVY
jgi:hypothetical protein